MNDGVNKKNHIFVYCLHFISGISYTNRSKREEVKLNTSKAIRVALAMKEMTQKQLAERMGMHESAISQLVNRASITTDKLKKVADALDMKVSELVKLGE